MWALYYIFSGILFETEMYQNLSYEYLYVSCKRLCEHDLYEIYLEYHLSQDDLQIQMQEGFFHHILVLDGVFQEVLSLLDLNFDGIIH